MRAVGATQIRAVGTWLPFLLRLWPQRCKLPPAQIAMVRPRVVGNPQTVDLGQESCGVFRERLVFPRGGGLNGETLSLVLLFA